MSAEDKSLKIGVNFNDKGGKAAGAALGDLKKRADEFNKTVGTLNKSLKTLNTELQLKVKDFKALGKEIDATGKIFKDQIKDVTAYTKALEKLNAALRISAKSARGGSKSGTPAAIVGGVAQPSAAGIAQGASAALGNAPSNPLFVQVVGGQGGNAGTVVPIPGGGFQIIPPGRGGGGGGGNQRNQPWFQGGQNITAFGGTMSTRDTNNIRMVADVAKGMANFVQEMKLLPAQNQAAVKDVRGQMFRNMMGGDFSDALAFTIMNKEGRSAIDKFGGTMATKMGTIAGGVADIAGGFSGGIPGVGAGIGAGVGGAIKTGLAGGAEAREAQTLQQGLDAVKRMNPVQMALFQNLMQNAQGGLAADRRLGGKGMNAAWAGVGQGMSPSESWQFFTQGANQFGAQAMMGTSQTSSKLVPTGRMIPNKNMIAAPGSITTPEQAAAYAAEVDRQIKAGTYATTPEMRMQNITTSQGGLGGAAIAMQKKGLNRDLMTQLMGQSQALLKGDDQQRVNQSVRLFQEAMSEGVKKGLSDPQSLEALATAIATNVTDPLTGAASGQSRYASLLTTGMSGANQNPLAISERAQGLEAFGNAIQSNPYLQNLAISQTNNELGGEGGTDALMALATASPRELLSQAGTGGRLDAFGFTDQQKITRLKNLTTTTVNMAAIRNTKLKDMLDANGGDVFKSLKDPKFVDLLSASSQGTLGGFGNYQDTKQGYTALSGLDQVDGTSPASVSQFQKKASVASPFAQAAATQATTQAQALSEAFKPENLGLFKEAMAATSQMFEKLTGMRSQALSDATETIKELEKLIDKIAKMGSGPIRNVTEKLDKNE
jgi:hypothetical protein